MPPPLANKSKGKGREVRRSRSRNTTPSSASTNTVTGIGYLDNDISKIVVPTSVQYSDILDKLGGSGHIPEPKALESLVEHLKTLSQLAETRGEACNAGIREISQKRKEVFEELREREQLDRDAEERLRMKREADDDEDMGRVSKGGKLKKRKDRGIARDERPLSNEAHGVAKQDGTDLKTDIPHRRGGKDSVAQFPKSDLSHMMTGTPPDKDFSNAKPTNQVSANTFATYIEPYVRPLTEEDIAFLKERGDRTTPFLLPRRGKKHYTEIWAEEDGSVNVDSTTQDREQLPLNQGRSGIDQMTDEIAETDQISAPPLVSRLYSLLRFEHRTLPEENTAGTASNNEDTNMNGIVNGDTMDIDSLISGVEPETKPLNSATTFVDASPNGFKIPAAKLEHGQLDERLKAELRYVGIFGQDDNPDYDAHYDDDIAERLRLLQAELKKQMIANGARKARLLEIARERLAYQEYSTIHDDLDSQVQQAYLKRTRTLGKSKKGSQAKHKPGGAGGGSHPVAPNASGAGVSRPGIGDVARTLMDRRKRWSDCIGPVFKDCKTTVPGKDESIFDPAVMEEYEKAELEGWDEEQE
ncbi:transcriptional regulator Ngg1 [Histoplasma capsulatum H143]|uniref:Transcriptional regulator Ngg1 n=1 Tax=Ajellomyces capsulatus (strain H143) TaxID=544712 RepID=C6HAQ8_AJECH|nr:transcriptional regulator Ngg1 [Histoplasma capsulatum H143]